MPTTHSLRPNLDRQEAIRRFSTRGVSGVLRSALWGPLRSLADVYVPFRLYSVEIRNGARAELQLLALDAVRGSLDLYGFPQLPGPSELVPVETRNCVPAALEEAHAEEILLDRVRRQLFRASFFRLRGLRLSVERIPGEFHIPYWIGFFGSGEHAHLAVIDAVRGCFEGPKARDLFESWLMG